MEEKRGGKVWKCTETAQRTFLEGCTKIENFLSGKSIFHAGKKMGRVSLPLLKKYSSYATGKCQVSWLQNENYSSCIIVLVIKQTLASATVNVIMTHVWSTCFWFNCQDEEKWSILISFYHSIVLFCHLVNTCWCCQLVCVSMQFVKCTMNVMNRSSIIKNKPKYYKL